ncbi:MAG: hypothetical protein RL213_1466 [Bacteroidota bacterium]|jgi:aspartate kinase
MKVLKFGGASVKDAESVRNVASILRRYAGEKLVVVVSAMGKTTNALEAVVKAHRAGDESLSAHLKRVREFHTAIIDGLGFPEKHALRDKVENCFTEIEWVTEEPADKSYNWTYDQIVSVGELMSTLIVSAFLTEQGMENAWLDARDIIRTDNTYREGKVDWKVTGERSNSTLRPLLENHPVVVTQGFIGSTSENFSTTLGREGSDYTAAILSYCLDAEEMIVWKDVPGVLSADPKYYDDAVKLEQISYLDAIELTFYGATVIHPKTIKPLENKRIPMRVCSFLAPTERGTLIGDFEATKPLVPCFIFKTGQILLSISAKDFSFIAEENLSRIFSTFARHNVKINLMQNSAISFSVCADNDEMKIPALIEDLTKEFKVRYNENLRLVTVRHYFPSTIFQLSKDKDILLEQRSRHTAQLVLREESGGIIAG